LKSIIIASFISLAITFGGYIGIVKLTAKRQTSKDPAAEVTKADVAAVEMQLADAGQQKALMMGMQGTYVSLQSNMDIAKNILIEEQRKLEQLHLQLVTDKQALKDVNEQSLSKLAKLYESMKPGEAAIIASQLDTRLLVEIVPRMKDRSAARMLSAMDTQKAVEITRLIASRKKTVGAN
jgi:flagellar motility protein MotE (MotC chaperone)